MVWSSRWSSGGWSSGALSSGLAEDRALRGEELVEAAFGEVQQSIELGAGVAAFFGGGLGLDETSVGGHDDVHIDFGLGVFFVAEVEKRRAFDDADRGGGYELGERRGFQSAGFDQGFKGEGKGDRGAGDGCGARAAVGLEDVAVKDDGALAEGLHVDDRAQAAADETLDLVGAARDFAALTLARGAGDSGAGQHGVFRGDPAAARVAQPGGNAGLDGGVAEDAGVAEGDEDRAFGGADKGGCERKRPELGGSAAITAVEGACRNGIAGGTGRTECRWIGYRRMHRGIVREGWPGSGESIGNSAFLFRESLPFGDWSEGELKLLKYKGLIRFRAEGEFHFGNWFFGEFLAG